MFDVRLTTADGSTRTEALRGHGLTLGRDAASNDVAVTGGAVSSRHCKLELGPHGLVLTDLGSRNGTFVNNERISAPTVVGPKDRIFIGSVLIELVPRAQPVAAPVEPVSAEPILRTPGPLREYRELHGRYLRYSEEWEYEGRPARLALNARELVRATRWMKGAQPGMQPEISRLQREFIEASTKVVSARRTKRILAIVAGVLVVGAGATAALMMWPDDAPTPEVEPTVEPDTDDDVPEQALGGFEAIAPSTPNNRGGEDEAGDVDKPIEHHVIPFETLPDIARRYGVSIEEIASWNFLNPDAPELETGSTLEIRAPKRRPLPQQRITYSVDAGEDTWTKLARRFDVPITRLQAYNPAVDLGPGSEIVVWIDPKPYQPRLPRKPLPEFTVDKRAQSVGKPNAGRLENGIQLPESPLYIRRTPRYMWGSSQTISNLQRAVAAFRQDVGYDGELILSDISRKDGGLLKPHKSHQAGRDIDIWLPTIKGVYKKKYLDKGGERPRRPMFDEVDWYALWGLVRALIQTDAVQYVFLDWRYQEFVYRAAVEMGATEDELDEWIQWPRPRTSGKGIFRHSKDHLSHIHVRFLCAPWEAQCTGKAAKP